MAEMGFPLSSATISANFRL